MPAAELVFPKSGGDPVYNSELNKYNQLMKVYSAESNDTDYETLNSNFTAVSGLGSVACVLDGTSTIVATACGLGGVQTGAYGYFGVDINGNLTSTPSGTQCIGTNNSTDRWPFSVTSVSTGLAAGSKWVTLKTASVGAGSTYLYNSKGRSKITVLVIREKNE